MDCYTNRLITRSAANIFALSLIFSSNMAAFGQQIDLSESQGVNLTIYNQNFGLVKDLRNVQLKEGINYVRFEDVAAQIDPTTVSFQSLTAPNSVVVREQNYQYDLMNPETILSKSVGKDVKFRQYLSNGQTHEIAGVLLNPPRTTVSNTDGASSMRSQGLVVKTADGIILNPSGEVELSELPKGLVSKPSLLWKLESNKSGMHKTEIAYQTSGINWRCDYVTIVNADDSKMDVNSWVTLDNQSGASYKDANLKLIAGDVHKVQAVSMPRMAFNKAMAASDSSIAPQFQEQSFAEYHMYSLQNKTDVNQNETKQLSLFNAEGVPTKKNFVFEQDTPLYWGGYPGNSNSQKIKVKLELDNSEANHLGIPMPKGKVRVYKKDQDGALQFIGEDLIDHTPRGEKVRIYIGDAFDLVGERKQTNVQQLSDRAQILSYEISLRNHKDTAVTITDIEHAYGQWKVTDSSQKYVKTDSHTFEFSVPVPANGEVKVTYTVEIKH